MELAVDVLCVSIDRPIQEIKPERNPDQFDGEEFKVDGHLLKIQNNAFHHKSPIVVGQKGISYHILRKFDQGSFGSLYYAR